MPDRAREPNAAEVHLLRGNQQTTIDVKGIESINEDYPRCADYNMRITAHHRDEHGIHRTLVLRFNLTDWEILETHFAVARGHDPAP